MRIARVAKQPCDRTASDLATRLNGRLLDDGTGPDGAADRQRTTRYDPVSLAAAGVIVAAGLAVVWQAERRGRALRR